MATKIKDGLFIGDAEASQDPEFIELNKITFVINCAGRQLPNLWEQHGLHYLTFPWTSDPECTLFDGGNVVIEQITSFVDEAAAKGESVLVHSLEGTGRCIACVAAYLMFRHRWSFEKALDFLCNKRPDAAPNAGFVQQLYRLDLRLYEQSYGKSKEPTEDDRVRHDQWVPLVPGLAAGTSKRHTTTGGQQPESLSSASRGKDAISTVIADAAAGRFGGAASTFPSLGRLTETQEEEIVLVHSFLNSQPQIDALPPGRVDYEDHVSKELHWIDRPRIDKLTAAGRLGRNNDRRQHMIPVSPRTGRAVPERPGNSSYNALSRGNKASTAASGKTSPVGILKTATPKRERNVVDDRGKKPPHLSPALELEVCALELTPSGDTAAAVSGAGGAGGAPLVASSLPSSRRGAGGPKVDDEVLVEDLSEQQSDRWGGRSGGTEGCDQSEHGTASGGELSSRSQAQGSALSPEDGAESSSSAEGSGRTSINSTPGGASKSEQQGSSFTRGEQGVHDPVAPARKEERQAWDGNSNNSGSSRGEDTAGANETDGGYGTGRTGDSGGEAKSSPMNAAKGSDKAGVSPPRAKFIPTDIAVRSKLDVGGRANSTTAQVSAPAGKSALPISKQLRRGGSEGSLKNTAIDISARTTATPTPVQDKTRLPHAPVGRTMKYDKTSSNDSPGPGWGPEDIRQKDVGSGGQRWLGSESAPPSENGAYEKWQDEWERKAAGPRLYPGADTGGGLQSLQQLAQTPNPQQRRLPLPRPQQELGQGDHRQGSSEAGAGSIFPQKRPSSAPSQRPDAPEDANSGSSGGGGSAAANPTPSSKVGVHRTRASSSVGAANQGYPAHGLMPSGLTVQMNANTDHDGRRGATAVSNEKGNGSSGTSTRPRYFSQTQEQPVGASGSSNNSSQRNAVASIVNGGGRGAGGGRPSSSTDKGHQARMSPDEAMDTEQRVANAHRSRRDRGNNHAGALPRDIRTSQPITPSSTDSPQARMGSPAPPPTSDRAVGANATGSDHSRAHGSRRSSGAASSALVPRTKATGIIRPKAGTLPLPSRRGSNGDSGGGSDGGGKGGEAARWANPAPRGRQGYGNGSLGTNGYPRSTDSRGGGGGGSVSSRTADAYTHLSHGGSPHRSHGGGGQQRHRAGGAPIYRSGSPAPVRGRKPAATSVSASATDPSRLVYQQRTRVLDKKPQAFGIPPAFRGYMASSGGVADGGERGTTARLSQGPSPTARDRVRRASTGSDRPVSSVPVPRASLVANRSEGRRPSTSEGITGGSGAGRRGRSASPAPRPNSASGRRRSSSPSPASLFTSKIDPSFDRPRWK